jgi:hypothetical protein
MPASWDDELPCESGSALDNNGANAIGFDPIKERANPGRLLIGSALLTSAS